MKKFWKNKNVLVTGGTGFIGSHMVDFLVKLGAKVEITSTKTEISLNKFPNSFNKVKIVKANLLEIEEVKKITKGKDVILNFAALDGGKSFKEKHGGEIFRTNCQLVQNILESARLNDVERILLMSSIEVYEKKENATEKSELNQNCSDGYVLSKIFSEFAAKFYSSKFGLKIAVARVGNTYGERDYSSAERGRVIPIFINKISKGEEIQLINGGNEYRSFIYVEDLVRSLLDLVEKYSTSDPVNIASSYSIKIRDLASILREIIENKKYPVVKKNMSKKRIVNNKKSIKIINFKENISLEEGLKRTVKYFLKKNQK